MSDVVVTITLDASGIKKGASEVEAKLKEIGGKKIEIDTKNATSSLSKLRDGLAMWGLAVAGIQKGMAMVSGAIKAIVGPAQEAEEAQSALEASLRQTGEYSPQLQRELQKNASALQSMTRYEDDAIAAGTALMQSIGNLSSEQLPGAQKAAIGLAAAFKIDLNTAFELVGKAAAGNTATLGRYGIVLDSSGTATDRLNQLLEIGAEKFSLAEASAKTNLGAIDQLTNIWGDLREEIGARFLPVIAEVATGVTDLIRGVLGSKSALEQNKEAIMGERVEFERLVITYESLHKNQNRSKEQNEAYARSINDLMTKYPNYLGKIDLEKGNWQEISSAIYQARNQLQDYLNLKIQKAVLEDQEDKILDIATKIVGAENRINEIRAGFAAGTLSPTTTYKRAVKNVDGQSSTFETYQGKSAEALEIESLILKLDKLNKKQQERREELQRTVEVASRLYALEPGGQQPGGGGSGAGGSGVGGGGGDVVAKQESQYQRLLNSLATYHKEVERASLSSYDKELAALGDKHTEEAAIIAQAEADKEITKEEANARKLELDSIYVAKSQIVIDQANAVAKAEIEKQAQEELKAKAEAKVKALMDEKTYYDTMQFITAGYYNWKVAQYEKEVAAMAISDEQKVELLTKLKADLEMQMGDSERPSAQSGERSWFFSGVLGYDPDSQEDQSKVQAIQTTYSNIVAGAQSMVSQLMSLSRQRQDEDIMRIEAVAAKESWSNERLLLEKKKINAKYEAEERRLRNIQKGISITQSIINTAEGMTAALKMGPILGPILAAMIGAMGAVQIALIASQKFASGGLFRGKGGPRDDSNIIAVSDGEYIVNAAATARHKPLLDSINYGSNAGAMMANGGYIGGGSAVSGNGVLEAKLDKVINGLAVLNANLVKKSLNVVVKAEAGVNTLVRKMDETRLRMDSSGYVQPV
jgi:hypothetical protein